MYIKNETMKNIHDFSSFLSAAGVKHENLRMNHYSVDNTNRLLFETMYSHYRIRVIISDCLDVTIKFLKLSPNQHTIVTKDGSREYVKELYQDWALTADIFPWLDKIFS